MSAPLYALLLAGGASRRMHADKALLAYQGRPQLLRAWALLQASAVEQCFVSIRAGQQHEPLRAGLPTLPDSVDSVGPAAGIVSAQRAHPHVAWLVLACDLPLLDADTLQALIRARDPGRDATAYASRHDGLPEPLCAIWEPSSAALLAGRLRTGRHCPRKALLQLRTQLLPTPGAALDNINTPGEAEHIRRQLELH